PPCAAQGEDRVPLAAATRPRRAAREQQDPKSPHLNSPAVQGAQTAHHKRSGIAAETSLRVDSRSWTPSCDKGRSTAASEYRGGFPRPDPSRWCDRGSIPAVEEDPSAHRELCRSPLCSRASPLRDS